MVEFGEQLRRAREEKGMTQQSLAEQLYVTRQSVSRWECGDRYPDLITTKKISEILEVSLDDLLSGKEMEKVVERNPVIENKVANNIMIALYAVVVLSMIIPIFDQMLRIPGAKEPIIEIFSIPEASISMFSTIIKIFCFVFGLVNALRGMFSPKRMGAVIVGYFIATCFSSFSFLPQLAGMSTVSIQSIQGLFLRGVGWQVIAVLMISLLPNAAGAVSAFVYFLLGKKQVVWPTVIILASVLEIIIVLLSKITILNRYSDMFTMNHTLGIIIAIAIYGLFIFQTVTLLIKRKRVSNSAKETSEQEAK